TEGHSRGDVALGRGTATSRGESVTGIFARAELERASRLNCMARSRRQGCSPLMPLRLHLDCARFAGGGRLGNTLGICMTSYNGENIAPTLANVDCPYVPVIDGP